MAKPIVTVVIPTYNREKLLPRALESVLKQTMVNWRVVIVDDCSTDKTQQLVNEYLGKDSRLVYYRMPKNHGLSHALNKGLELVDTKYMLQLDSDDWLEEKALDSLVRHMEEESPNTALVYSNFMMWREGKGTLRKLRPFNTSDKYEFICYPHPYYPRFYRTSCLVKVGGWDTNDRYEGRYLEDRKIMFKLIQRYDFAWIDEHLYNLTRDTNDRLTKAKDIHNELKKKLIIDTLKKWGYPGIPIFHTKNGWLGVKLVPKKQ